MPQKRNPYALSIVRGAGGVLIGRLTGFLAVVKSPSARSDNLIFAYGEIPRALELSAKVSSLMSGVVRTLTVNEERMWQELEGGFSQATDLAEFVMLATGIDYRSAYRVVGNTVRSASKLGLRGLDITSNLIDEAAQEICGHDLSIDAEQLAVVLNPKEIVATRTSAGGAAPHVVQEMAERYIDHGEQLTAAAQQQIEMFAASELELLRQARELVGD